jgi:hypothetical protein
MSNLVSGANALRILILGEKFSFTIDAGLPPINLTDEFTGHWQHVGDGSIENPLGIHILTSEQLMEQYDGITMFGTYVWKPVTV